MTKKNQKGFTIVELLVATVAFSVVLLISSSVVIGIGKLYYKNIIQSTTQEVTRSISDEITRSFQFASSDKIDVPDDPLFPNQHRFCIGDTRYTYVFNQQVVGGALGFRRERLTTPVCTGAATGSQELLSENMRLLAFSAVPIGAAHKIYDIKLRIAYGDNDLLSHYNNDGTPVNAATVIADAQTANCKSGISGSSFCAVSALDNVIRKRLD